MKLFVRLIAALSVLLAAATAAIAQASGHGWLGVQVAQVTKADADALGWEDLHGVKVMKTVPGGPAEQAGLMPGDLILSSAALRRTTSKPSWRVFRARARMQR